MEISGRFQSDGHYLIVPCTVTNRLKGHVDRIRYIHGIFAETTEPTPIEIRRSERQMDLPLAPGEQKEMTFEIDYRNEWSVLSKEVDQSVSAFAPFDLDATPVPEEEAWAHEH